MGRRYCEFIARELAVSADEEKIEREFERINGVQHKEVGVTTDRDSCCKNSQALKQD
jgi:hypothetical protein